MGSTPTVAHVGELAIVVQSGMEMPEWPSGVLMLWGVLELGLLVADTGRLPMGEIPWPRDYSMTAAVRILKEQMSVVVFEEEVALVAAPLGDSSMAAPFEEEQHLAKEHSAELTFGRLERPLGQRELD